MTVGIANEQALGDRGDGGHLRRQGRGSPFSRSGKKETCAKWPLLRHVSIRGHIGFVRSHTTVMPLAVNGEVAEVAHEDRPFAWMGAADRALHTRTLAAMLTDVHDRV